MSGRAITLPYGDMSGRVIKILADFAPELEIYSIDEAFVGLAGMGDRPEAHMRQARHRVAVYWNPGLCRLCAHEDSGKGR